MSNERQIFVDAIERQPFVNMGERQEALRQRYQENPQAAFITDGARTSSRAAPATSALYTEVFPHNANSGYAVGVHSAVGGESDFPVPGDILCAAMAACLDSCIRIIANRLGIKLKSLEVSAEAAINVLGTLRIDDAVPVGFQDIQIGVAIETDAPVKDALMDALLAAAEHSCVIIQTLRQAPSISVSRIAAQDAEGEENLASVA